MQTQAALFYDICMTTKQSIVETFEKAVQADIETLTEIARVMGDQAADIKKSDPSIDMWNIPQGEMQHCINGARQTLVYASMGHFDVASRGLSGYVPRVAAIEDGLGISVRPSEIIQSIKDRLDQTINAHPDVFKHGSP